MNKRRLFILLPLIMVILISCDPKKNDPVVSIVSPVANTAFNEGEIITVSADATDNDGQIVEVQFFIDNQGFASANTFPYSALLDLYPYTSGSHTLKAKALDNDGNSSEASTTFSITPNTGGIPEAGFKASTRYGEPPLTVTFTDTSRHNPREWIWSFSDGTTSILQNPTVTFDAVGDYMVSLTVVNSYGTDTKTEMNFIKVVSDGQAPGAQFSADITKGPAPLIVTFTDESEPPADNWLWNFSDGTTSTDRNPMHTFTTPGIYDITLLVSNAFGEDTYTHTQYIQVLKTCPETVTDVDGNTYNAVSIGDQCWMQQDMRATTYANGTPLNVVTDDLAWKILLSGDKACCFYDNNSDSDYGALYTWSAAMNHSGVYTSPDTPLQGICPDGWHIPDNGDWAELEDYLGYWEAAYYLKESGTAHWLPDNYANNESGFTALPGGMRDKLADFVYMGSGGYWWAGYSSGATYADIYKMYNDDAAMWSGTEIRRQGLSVRCLQNED